MSVANFVKCSEPVAAFLQKVEFLPAADSRPAQVEAFQEAMQEGLNHPVDDMLMIPTWLSVPADDPANMAGDKKILVLDIGGSNIRVGRAEPSSAGRFEIFITDRFPMPGKGKLCSRKDFLDRLVDCLEPLWEPGCRIGLCFSYEMDMQPDHDGRIIRFSKEVELPELEGELLGRALIEALNERGMTGTGRVVLLNDTVAALLGGVSAGHRKGYESYVGLIIGTGTNTAYVERVDRIKKIQAEAALQDGSYPADHMIINMESGGYRTAFQTPVDRALDAASAKPNHHRFEKMISGQYLGELVYRLALMAVEEGLLSEQTGAFLRRRGSLETQAADQLLAALTEAEKDNSEGSDRADSKQAGQGFEPADFEGLEPGERGILGELAAAVFSRAAWLTAVQLEAILRYTGKGQQAYSPVLCTVEGTTYSKSVLYKKALAQEIAEHLTGKGLYIDLVEVPQSNLVGAAVAALAD